MQTETLAKQAARLGIELRPGIREAPADYWDRYEPEAPETAPTIPVRYVETATGAFALRERVRALAEATEAFRPVAFESFEEVQRFGGDDLRVIPIPDDLEYAPQEPESPDAAAFSRGFEVFLNRLTEKQLQALRLTFWVQLSYQEAADELGLTKAGMQRRIAPAIESLRHSLREAFPPQPLAPEPKPKLEPQPEPSSSRSFWMTDPRDRTDPRPIPEPVDLPAPPRREPPEPSPQWETVYGVSGSPVRVSLNGVLVAVFEPYTPGECKAVSTADPRALSAAEAATARRTRAAFDEQSRGIEGWYAMYRRENLRTPTLKHLRNR